MTHLKCKTLVLVVDSDFSGLVVRGREGFLSDVAVPNEPRSCFVLTSCRADQIAFEADNYKSSVFTHVLLQQLRENWNKPILHFYVPVKEEVGRVVDSIRRNRLQEPEFSGRAAHPHVCDLILGRTGID